MRRGEITGQFFDTAKADIGMPYRPTTILKKHDRKNISTMDDIIDPTQTPENEPTFESYDPITTAYAKEISEQLTPHELSQKVSDSGRTIIDSRLDFDRARINKTTKTDMDSNMRRPQLKQRESTVSYTEKKIHNVSSYNTDYINSLSFSIYNTIAERSIINFCVFPIGVLSTIIENDQTLKKILKSLDNNEIFHQLRIQNTNHIMHSRSSVILNLQSDNTSKMFTHYEDNVNHIIEMPLLNPDFAIGFLYNKNGEMIQPTQRLFMTYIMNLKRSNINVYCPAFKITNKLDLNKILSYMNLIDSNNIKYEQTIYFEFKNNVFIKKSSVIDPIDLSNNFIFYIRYVPNNVILFIGRHGEL